MGKVTQQLCREFWSFKVWNSKTSPDIAILEFRVRRFRFMFQPQISNPFGSGHILAKHARGRCHHPQFILETQLKPRNPHKRDKACRILYFTGRCMLAWTQSGMFPLFSCFRVFRGYPTADFRVRRQSNLPTTFFMKLNAKGSYTVQPVLQPHLFTRECRVSLHTQSSAAPSAPFIFTRFFETAQRFSRSAAAFLIRLKKFRCRI